MKSKHDKHHRAAARSSIAWRGSMFPGPMDGRVVMVKGRMVGCSAYVVPFQSSGYNHQRVVSLFHEAERLAAKAQEARSG